MNHETVARFNAICDQMQSAQDNCDVRALRSLRGPFDNIWAQMLDLMETEQEDFDPENELLCAYYLMMVEPFEWVEEIDKMFTPRKSA